MEGRVLDSLPEVRLSEPHLFGVLTNLLDNAVRHTSAGGEVSLEAGVAHDSVWVSVGDECGGVADERLPHLSESGFRAESAHPPGGGSGLGLAIVRGLVQAHVVPSRSETKPGAVALRCRSPLNGCGDVPPRGGEPCRRRRRQREETS